MQFKDADINSMHLWCYNCQRPYRSIIIPTKYLLRLKTVQ